MEFKLWIDGKWVDSKGGGKIPLRSRNRQENCRGCGCQRGGRESGSSRGEAGLFDGRWSRLVPSERSKAIWKMADLLEKHAEEFAKLESENTGKPYKFVSLGADLMFSIDNLRFFAGAAREYARFACWGILARLHIHVSARPGRGCGSDRSVELSADDGNLEDRSHARGGMHNDLQARISDAADQPYAGEHYQRSGYTRWRGQRHHRTQSWSIAG